MIAVLDSMVFAAAFTAAMWVFAFTLMPALPRIASILRGEADHQTRGAFVAVSDRRVRTRARPVPQVRRAAFREAA